MTTRPPPQRVVSRCFKNPSPSSTTSILLRPDRPLWWAAKVGAKTVNGPVMTSNERCHRRRPSPHGRHPEKKERTTGYLARWVTPTNREPWFLLSGVNPTKKKQKKTEAHKDDQWNERLKLFPAWRPGLFSNDLRVWSHDRATHPFERNPGVPGILFSVSDINIPCHAGHAPSRMNPRLQKIWQKQIWW